MTDWDDAYANGAHINNGDAFPGLWANQAAAFRTSLSQQNRCQLDASYGDDPRELLDLFLPNGAPLGLMVFVHGGYWKAFDKSSFSHLATGALGRSYAVAMPSYNLCPDVKISQITQQIAAAIETAAGMIAGPIILTGHSAGGHLVTRMLCGDINWTTCFEARIQNVVSISGLHDLRPLLKTKMNDDFGMDMAEAQRESPVLHKDVLPVPVTAWVGADERPVFIEQSNWLENAWPNAKAHVAQGYHHFDVIDELAQTDSPLMDALIPA